MGGRMEMSSDRQIEANRQNAQRSTGPRTADGKARVASNALKHGLTGKQVVLPGEDPAEFDSFRSDLIADLAPQGALEEILAEKIVTDTWRLRRVPVLEAALHRRGCQMGAEEGLNLTDSVITTGSLAMYAETFTNLWRYEIALSRSSSRTLHELQRLQAARAGERVPPPAAIDVDVSINGNGVNPE
jgi:hypothetical protein